MHLLYEDDDDIYSSITGNDGGFFCPNCLVVVLDTDVFARYAEVAADFDNKPLAGFTVAGFVDVRSIPEEKRHLPVGGEDNPVPLVPFLNVNVTAPSSG